MVKHKNIYHIPKSGQNLTPYSLFIAYPSAPWTFGILKVNIYHSMYDGLYFSPMEHLGKSGKHLKLYPCFILQVRVTVDGGDPAQVDS